MAARNTSATEPAAAPEATTVDTEPAAATEEASAPAAVPEDKLTNAKIDSEAKGMKAILDARPKRTIKIKAAEGAPPVGVGINGYTYRVPVNKHVEVPDVVADLLEKGDYI